MDENITKMKKPRHNVYGLNPFPYKVAVALCIALWILFFIDVPIRHLSPVAQISIWLAVLAIIPLVTFAVGKNNRANIIPYRRENDFEFLGLYNLKEDNLDNRRDILKRDEEIKYMCQVLEEIIFPQVSVKQALCVTGPSGSGKSIILNFFKQTFKDEYSIFDFSGNYREFGGRMASLIGSNIDLKISELTAVGKVVVILDQFERFFFLSKKDQEQIHSTIKYLCKKNTGIIISLREEYLADFLKRFDMNNLLSEDEMQNPISGGVLQKMFSVVELKDDRNSAAFSLLNQNKTEVWQNQTIKNNATVHLDTQHDRAIMEKIGATLLYCRNQNSLNVQLNGENSNASILESKCRTLFGESEGSKLYNKHINEPLIEQQIIFHMAEFNQKILLYSADELKNFVDKENNELLEQYFDHQLASCDNYFHASRLLYLLSQARIHQLALKTQDLENYLFPNLFEKRGHEHFMNVVQQLETIQLIRKNTEGSALEYEIAHDFIAATYSNYCSTNMERNVKSALDLFIAEYRDERRNISFLETISRRENIYAKNFYRYVTYFGFVFMVATYFVERFVFNPWTTIWSDFNPYGAYMPTYPLFITLLSGVYLFCMYDKTVKYYRGEKIQTVKMLYLVFAIFASMAVFAYPHFLFFDGMGLAVATLNIALLLDERYRQTCRNELLAYGAKSFMMGLVYAGAHIFFLATNNQFADFLILSEFIMFTILVAYAFFVHMTQEFLYARMSDSAGEKI